MRLHECMVKEAAYHQSLLVLGGGAGQLPRAQTVSQVQTHGVCLTASARLDGNLHHSCQFDGAGVVPNNMHLLLLGGPTLRHCLPLARKMTCK